MDDKQIEQMLHDSWSPDQPKGMRGRVLRASRRELARPKRRFPITWGWQTALMTAAIILILLTNISDHNRLCRLSVLADGGKSVEGINQINLKERQVLMGELVAKSVSDDPFADSPRRKESL